MTHAATRQYALALSAVVGVVASIVAVALIALVLGSPERVVLAMNEQELASVLHLVLDQLTAMARAVARLFS